MKFLENKKRALICVAIIIVMLISALSASAMSIFAITSSTTANSTGAWASGSGGQDMLARAIINFQSGATPRLVRDGGNMSTSVNAPNPAYGAALSGSSATVWEGDEIISDKVWHA